MGDDPTEQRIRFRRFWVGVGIEGVAGEFREVIDVRAGDASGAADDGVAERQFERFFRKG